MNLNGMGAVIMIIIVIAVIVILAVLTVYILFLLNLKRLLDQVSNENRMMPSGNVFLILIPFFGLVYGFIMFPKISDSIHKEYESRGMVIPGDGLKALGMTFAVLSVMVTIVNYVAQAFSGIVSLGLLVILIIYWVKSASIKKELALNSGNSRADLLD